MEENALKWQITLDTICDLIVTVFYPQDLPRLSQDNKTLFGNIDDGNPAVEWWEISLFRLRCTF